MPTFVNASSGSVSMKRSVAKVVMEPINFYISLQVRNEWRRLGSNPYAHQFQAELVEHDTKDVDGNIPPLSHGI
jgi:hypothetical protein